MEKTGMNYTDEEWERIKKGIRRKNIAYNIKVIRALWQLKHGSYGDRVINGNEYNSHNLFGTLEKSQETLRQWELQQIDLKKDKMFKWADTIEKKTDIPGEYLTGQEAINIVFSDGNSACEKYEVFIDLYVSLHDLQEELNNKESKAITNKEIDTTEDVKKMTLSQIESYIKKLEKDIQNEFKKTINTVKDNICKIKKYNQKLEEELKNLLVDDFENKLFQQDTKLYRLVYFIYRGKKSSIGESLTELIRALNNKHAKELGEYGESLLYEYIISLRNQLKLAEATYIVCSNMKKFDNTKNYKNLFD